jgi:hypothetical protein
VRLRAGAGLLVALSLLAVGCPSRSESGAAPSGFTGGAGAVPSVAPGGAPTAEAAIRKLCVAPAGTAGATATPSAAASPQATPSQIAQIENEVEQVRGLTYERPVAVEAVTSEEMQQRVEKAFDETYPAGSYDRRTAAWRTIGVIPPDADLRESLRSFLGGQVIGFYDPESKELVYESSGSADLGLQDRLVLAHELTHALDDQHFDLTRLDDLAARCEDERSEAALGLIEGNAQFVAAGTLARFPSGDLGDALGALLNGLGDQPSVAGVPPFVQAIEIWPYTEGLLFVTKLAVDGGTAAVDEAFRHPPTTTEQVMHPDQYPSDVPSRVDVPDLSADLGPRWGDLDAMDVGEEWLDAMLNLRLDGSTADAAAAGWDGGVYRAWSDGTDVAVVMDTAWDSVGDATAFASAMNDWNAKGDAAASVTTDGTHVRLAFATQQAVLDRVDSALADG